MKPDSDTETGITRLGVLVEGGLALLALALGWLVGYSPLATIEPGWQALPGHILAACWGVAAAVPMLLLLLWVESSSWQPLLRLRHIVENSIAPLFAHLSVAQLALISAMAGVGEELLFRGLLQAGVTDWIGGEHGPWVGIALASVAFGLAHSITRAYVVLATAIGAYLGWAFWISDHLVVPIVAHAVYDFLALVYFVKWKSARRD